MAKKSAGEEFFTGLVFAGVTWALSFLTALIAMVLEGAVADNFGWPTFGYMTWYFAVMLFSLVGEVFFRGITQTLVRLKD